MLVTRSTKYLMPMHKMTYRKVLGLKLTLSLEKIDGIMQKSVEIFQINDVYH